MKDNHFHNLGVAGKVNKTKELNPKIRYCPNIVFGLISQKNHRFSVMPEFHKFQNSYYPNIDFDSCTFEQIV